MKSAQQITIELVPPVDFEGENTFLSKTSLLRRGMISINIAALKRGEQRMSMNVGKDTNQVCVSEVVAGNFKRGEQRMPRNV